VFDLASFLNIPPFSLDHRAKSELLIRALGELTQYHYERCSPYQSILDLLNSPKSGFSRLEDIPFIPVRLFKEYELVSVDKAAINKTMTSSGTTGQRVSRIYLDKTTSTNQTKVLTKIMSAFVGTRRMPMLIIDSSAVLKNRNLFSARGAGIMGFSMFGHDVTYALDENMNLLPEQVQAFVAKHAQETILIFGFTFMIWEHFFKALKKSGVVLALGNAIMIHGGGWKKIQESSVDNATFKKSLHEVCGLKRIHNYYGMVEQTGSIFMECEQGHLHASIFSDILIRDHKDFSSLARGKSGLVQLVSLLPMSYPGHSLLSEDLGELLGEDDCSCGRKGKYFRISGRVKNAEIRGCGDTYAIGR
jgi:phenylacetate-coenzyme A ligase PaaK-like adenylate-forming protein